MEKALLEKIEHAKKLIAEYREMYPNHLIAFSGGKDSTVLLHLVCESCAHESLKDLRIDAVLSNTEFQETYDFISEISKFYDVSIEEHYYENDLEKPEEASRHNKTEKFKHVLKDVECWFSGIRRDEGATREEIRAVEERDGLVKVNPLVDFTEKDIWRYLAIYRVPVNKAYLGGYRSLSCRLSSYPEERGDEKERGGRWKGSACEAGECGIHSQSLR